MKRVYLYFGSFNPPHIGHLAIAHWLLNSNKADELWFIVSPHNPLKSPEELAPVEHRLEMMRMATKVFGDKVKVSDIELTMAQPSYTYDTMQRLKELYSDYQFTIVMGEDNYRVIESWSRYRELLSEFPIAVYPRSGVTFQEPISLDIESSITELTDVPTFNISSSLLREYLSKGVDISLFTTNSVAEYIKMKGIYTNTQEVASLLDRAKSLYKEGDRQSALNLFLKIENLDPSNSEAKVYIELINAIYDFSYMEIYNP